MTCVPLIYPFRASSAPLYGESNSSHGCTAYFRKSFKRHSLAPEFQALSVSLVVVLFLRENPPAVIFAIGAIVINSIYGMFFGWPLTHVANKALKRTSPFIANMNAPGSVKRVANCFWVVTPSFHGAPNFVSVCLGKTVGRGFLPRNNNPIAPAAKAFTMHIGVFINNLFGPTVAATKKLDFLINKSSLSNKCPQIRFFRNLSFHLCRILKNTELVNIGG